jgi:hypothetical protein
VANTGPVFGQAVGQYDYGNLPGGPWTDASMFASAESTMGTMGCFRTYSDPGPMPSSWSTTPNVLFGTPTARWQWHSYKPDLATLAAGSYYNTIKTYCGTIPINGMKKILTVWHEADVGTKIPNTGTAGQFKQGFYEFFRAVKDSNHPDLVTAIVFGQKFSIDKCDQIMAATSVTTAALRSVVDMVAWDPYNGASHDGDYSSGKQGAAGVSFYLDTLFAWNATNFPNARFGIGEFGYRPNQADLSMRPAYLQAFMDRMKTEGALVACYFNSAVKPEKENWLGWYSNPRSSTNWTVDTQTRNKVIALNTAFPAYAS